MTVRVRLLGELRRYLLGRVEPLIVDLPENATVADLASALEISPSGEVIIGINGQLGRLDSGLADGDEIVFVSPMSGG